MPLSNNLDPGSVQKTFERENAVYKGMEWELEDLLTSGFVDAFQAECPRAITRATPVADKLHREMTADGKARFHRFVKQQAIRSDLTGVVETMKALRFYLGLLST